jgi:hypothetical protein
MSLLPPQFAGHRTSVQVYYKERGKITGKCLVPPGKHGTYSRVDLAWQDTIPAVPDHTLPESPYPLKSSQHSSMTIPRRGCREVGNSPYQLPDPRSRYPTNIYDTVPTVASRKGSVVSWQHWHDHTTFESPYPNPSCQTQLPVTRPAGPLPRTPSRHHTHFASRDPRYGTSPPVRSFRL